MKRYKHTWFNGMLEDPKGEYSLIRDLEKAIEQRDWEANKKEEMFTWYRNTHDELCNERILTMLLSYTTFLMLLGNVGQLIYHLNT